MSMTNDELTVMSLIDLSRSSARGSGSSERTLVVALAGVYRRCNVDTPGREPSLWELGRG